MQKKIILISSCLLVIIFSYASTMSLSKADQEEIKKALQIQGITEKELGFEKKWAVDSIYRLKIVTELLDNPMHVPAYLDKSVRTVDSLKQGLSSQSLFLYNQLDIKITNGDIKKIKREITKQVKNLPKRPSIINTINASYEIADKYLHQSIKNLTDLEINTLLMMAPVLWGDEEDSLSGLKGALHREFGIEIDTSVKVEIDTILNLFTKIDRRALALSGIVITAGIEQILEDIKNLSLDLTAKITVPNVKGAVYYYEETKAGKLVIGSEEDNVYQGDYALIIDLGGNDVYRARVAGGIGVLASPFSVVIDLAGDDLYDSADKLFNLGAGLFGCGVLIDMQGNDTYKSSHYGLGAGLLGTGVLLDFDGDDIYSGGCFCQGAGNLGIGVLLDVNGDDTYRGYENCQAFSSTWGYGLLTDFSGNDLYYAGGK
ncbi:MAG: hypothetical protein ABIK31_04710, partial [candidate division WOR-3 bacterium]